jgi:hypothetical protein
MSDIPPKQSPDAASGSGVVAMYHAASQANAESFPVLKAFQDYIEAERAQARKRVVQLSIFFAVLMVVVVTGFLAAGIFMLRNMSDVQSKLLDVALAAKEAPAPQPSAPAPVIVQPAPAPFLEDSVRLMTKAAADLQSSMDKKMDGVSDMTAKVHDRVAAQDGELGKLRDELKKMQEQSEQLKGNLVTLQEENKAAVAAAVDAALEAQAKQVPVGTPAAAVPPAPVTVTPPAPAPTVTVAALPAPPPIPTVEAVPAPPAPPPAARFPPAEKEPPAAPDGVTPPTAPAGRLATAIPLKTKHTGTVPWRVLIPD